MPLDGGTTGLAEPKSLLVGWGGAARGTGGTGKESPAVAASTWPVTQTGVWSLEAE